jgi:hypothetical protein
MRMGFELFLRKPVTGFADRLDVERKRTGASSLAPGLWSVHNCFLRCGGGFRSRLEAQHRLAARHGTCDVLSAP